MSLGMGSEGVGPGEPKAGSPRTSISGVEPREPENIQSKPGLPGCYKVTFVKVAKGIYINYLPVGWLISLGMWASISMASLLGPLKYQGQPGAPTVRGQHARSALDSARKEPTSREASLL